MLHTFYPVLPDYGWLERLVPLGVKTVQLRLKDAGAQETRRQISASLELCAKHSCQLIVNDYWQEAIDLGADYIHLGQEDLAGADLAAIKQAGLRLGISTHSHAELETALKADPDYVALGPVYETKLKKMKWAPQGLARVTEWKSLVNAPQDHDDFGSKSKVINVIDSKKEERDASGKPAPSPLSQGHAFARPALVAIAGITVERAPDVLAAGADSLAVVTDIVTHENPESRVAEWLAFVASRG